MPNPPWTKNTIGQITLQGQVLGQVIVNTFHFEASAVTEATLTSDTVAQLTFATFTTAWRTAVNSAWLELQGTDYSLTMLKAQVLERPATWAHRLTPTETVITTGGGGSIENGSVESMDSAAVIRWRSNLAGKTHRGRSYIGPLAQGLMSNGLLQNTYVTKLQAFIDLAEDYFVTHAPSPTWNMTVYSKPYNQGDYGYVRGSGSNREFYFPPEYAGNSTNIVTGAIDPVVRTQRRRQIGVGV